MAYNKTTWKTGDVITAEKLNNMEGGIEGLQPLVVTLLPAVEGEPGEPAHLDKTYNEIMSASACAFHEAIDGGTLIWSLTTFGEYEGSYLITLINLMSLNETRNYVASSADGSLTLVTEP